MSSKASCIELREIERVENLCRTNLRDTSSREALDHVKRLASQIFEVPISLVTLLTTNKLWFKSHAGLDVFESSKDFAICSEVTSRRDVFIVEDTTDDPRFAVDHRKSGVIPIRFYAGAPLELRSGQLLGTLCIVDTKPRLLSARGRRQLEMLADLFMMQIELRLSIGYVNEATRLPNAAKLVEDLELARAETPGERRGLLLIEMMTHSRYEEIACAIGLRAVQEATRAIAQNLQAALGPNCTVYHVAETRACVEIRGVTPSEQEAFCKTILNQLEKPFTSGGYTVRLDLRAGMVEFDLDEGFHDALRRVTSALNEANFRGERYRWYDAKFDVAHCRAFLLTQDVWHGLAAGQFRLVYQPKFNVRAGKYTGVEALARWKHPVLGDVSPAEFIPLIETTALIHEFTPWVIETALAQQAEWHEAGICLTMAVNVSSRNLDRPGFADSVRAACERRGIDASWLHIECTENAVMTSGATRTALVTLRDMGVNISLDDFGMGYSNLACLRGLPIQMLKLDQSLIIPMGEDAASQAFVRALIELGHLLGFHVLAEGVEGKGVCEMLLDAGCDALQGYFLSRPIAASEIPAFIAAPPVDPCEFQRAKDRNEFA